MTTPAKSRRGRETALDMVRTLAVVFALVVPLWFFGQSSPGDSKKIRPVDAGPALTAFAQDTGAPVATAPEGWVVNVARYDGGVVRIGFVDEARDEAYAEFTGGTGAGFLETYAGKGRVEGTVDVGGVTWQRFTTTDDHESLVREVSGVTLVVGGVRETSSRAQLEQLAATVR